MRPDNIGNLDLLLLPAPLPIPLPKPDDAEAAKTADTANFSLSSTVAVELVLVCDVKSDCPTVVRIFVDKFVVVDVFEFVCIGEIVSNCTWLGIIEEVRGL